MKALFAALRFLTILPVPGSWAGGEKELGRSVAFFPFVGLLIGGAAAAAAVGLRYVLPPLPAGVIVVILLIAASGALHLDGLADTADGFLSSRPRARILEIMRDSHTGAMGVIAIACILLLKTASLCSIASRDWWRVALLAPVAGRCALVFMMLLLRYARSDGGLGTAFFRRKPVFAGIVALVVLAATAFAVAGLAGIAAAGVAVAATLLFALWCLRKIGGATGDTLGAACEIAEAAVLLAMAAIAHMAPLWFWNLPG